jgi:flagellar hook-basal body complex protein FliE
MTLPVAAVATPSASPWAMPPTAGGEWSAGAVSGADPSQQAPAAAGPAGGFGSMLSGAVESLQHTQDVAAAQSQALATGQTQDVTSVVTAVQEASLSMQLASQVRNKAVEAYSEIFHTQV